MFRRQCCTLNSTLGIRGKSFTSSDIFGQTKLSWTTENFSAHEEEENCGVAAVITEIDVWFQKCQKRLKGQFASKCWS